MVWREERKRGNNIISIKMIEKQTNTHPHDTHKNTDSLVRFLIVTYPLQFSKGT